VFTEYVSAIAGVVWIGVMSGPPRPRRYSAQARLYFFLPTRRVSAGNGASFASHIILFLTGHGVDPPWHSWGIRPVVIASRLAGPLNTGGLIEVTETPAPPQHGHFQYWIPPRKLTMFPEP
jgi:hypothetical protein